ncbi:MAG: hypothetical protein JNJ59_26960, partial [Deltaproteobacteria bacterium]|nr:hypothetical protein [Deltaproteobacteria bacterium]
MSSPRFAFVLASLFVVACGGDSAPGTVEDADTAPDTSEVFDTTAPDTEPLDLLEPDTAVADTADGDTAPSPDTVQGCGAPPFTYLCPCTRNNQCDSGWCVPVDEDEVAMRCSRTCQDECDNGWECRGVAGAGDPVFLCLPPIDTLCAACTKDADCKEIGAKCVAFIDGSFCGRDCQGAPDACPNGFACGEVKNDFGQITGYQCLPNAGSCVCPEDTDYANDPANCGYCGNECSFVGASAGCSESACRMGDCLTGFINLNRDESDGCEYACTPVSGEAAIPDEPETDCTGSACDQDCDGIDGSYASAVFVSATGGRGASGAPYDPINNISDGIAKARELGRPHVYVASGTYPGELRLAAGVSVFGGYSNDGRWVRDLGLHRSIVSNDAGTTGIRAVVADGIVGSRTVFDGFDVLSGNNPNPGGSSYAIWVRGSDDQLVLR